jgi:hypothetical protein
MTIPIITIAIYTGMTAAWFFHSAIEYQIGKKDER